MPKLISSVLLNFFILGCAKVEDDASAIPDAPQPCVKDLSDLGAEQIYETIYFQSAPSAVYVYTPYCSWCEVYAPVFETVCQQRRAQVKFYKIDTYKVSVDFHTRTLWPITYFFYFDDAPMGEAIGFMDEEALNRTIDDFLDIIDGSG